MFIGYKIIDGSNIIFKSQFNTTNNQMSVNTFNKYISKDIQNSINVEGPIFSESKSDGSEYTLNNIEKYDEVEYIYTIKTKKNGNLSYIVTIKDNRYSISRKDSNNVTLNLIDNEKLSYEGEKIKAPLIIDLKYDKSYYISLDYKGEKNTQDEYNFQVTSRYVSGGNLGENPGENQGGNTEGNTGENQGGNTEGNTGGNTYNDYLIFKYTKKSKIDYSEDYNWEYTIEVNLDYFDDETITKANKPIFSDSFLIRRYGEKLESYTSSWYIPGITFNDSRVKQIKGFTIKFDDGIIIKDLKLMDNDNKVNLTESNKEYTYIMSKNVEYGDLLSGIVEIEESANINHTYNIIVKFLY